MDGKAFSESMFPFPTGTKVRVTVEHPGAPITVDCLFDGWGVFSERIKDGQDVYPMFKSLDNPSMPAIFDGYNSDPGKFSRYTLPKFKDIISVEVI